MKAVSKEFGRFVREADGLEGVEYAMMTALLVGAIVAALITLGLAISTTMGSVSTTITI